ncbi:MAG: nuclear transport factor 2 family protein [Gammaproteobacteria bacterium]|nr:nuclear transport factor 2 family protein [Gammaproteobacteria bacterium]
MIRTGMALGVGVTVLAGLVSTAWAADQSAKAMDPIAVVQAFNDAFARKDIEGLTAQLIEGGVQFDLRPAHADQNAAQGLTEELKARWYGVTPILFAGTESYARKVKVIDSRSSSDMATVWATITTEMRMPKSDKANSNSFTEVYLLVNTPDGWKIGAMMDDRATDRISTTTPTQN